MTTPLACHLRIFIVENHDDTRELLAMYLTGLGHTVFSAATMGEALENFPAHDCEVLISDIGLPDGDGWELLRRLPQPHPIFAIAMSGFGMNADHLRSREAGFRRHLLKPFVTSELDDAIAEAAREADALAHRAH